MKLFLKNLLFTLLIPGTVSVYVPLFIARAKHITSSPILLIIGIALLASGSVIYLWTVWDFAKKGRGTPLPIDAPKKLVVHGLYSYSRNPMYLGVLLVILGWAVLFSDVGIVVYALCVGLIVHLFVLLYEEPMLKQLFGEEYVNYQKKVVRWIPRLYRPELMEPNSQSNKMRKKEIILVTFMIIAGVLGLITQGFGGLLLGMALGLFIGGLLTGQDVSTGK